MFDLPQPARRVLLWLLFYLICFGLGYPTLNRYDPRKALSDSASYSKLATDGPGEVEGYFRFRVLEPYLTRPLFHLLQGHVGSWDAVMLAFLLVNSFFVASTALLISILGYEQLGDYAAVLFGAALYLLNFAVSNAQLAGLVDAGEGFFLMALVAAMFFKRWWLLPVLGILGALTKESFVPFSIAMAATWWMMLRDSSPARRNAALCIAALTVVELATITTLQSFILRHLTWPWTFAAGLDSHSNHVVDFFHPLVDRSSWFILIWLLPLGLPRIREFSRPWVWAAASASLVAMLLNAYHTFPGPGGGSGGGLGRCVFNVAGPLLSLSAARFLTAVKKSNETPA